MKKILLLIYIITIFPLRFFTKVSPFAIVKNGKVSKKSSIKSFSRFYNGSIEDYSYINRNCLIQNTTIGKFSSIADNCIIGLPSHPLDWVSSSPVFHKGMNSLKKNFYCHEYNSISQTLIGNDVWIGSNVVIKSGITIGDGAVIGAGSIVTKDVDPYTIVAGNPAKIIKKRFNDEIINRLIDSNWWNWEESKIQSNAGFFNDVKLFLYRTEEGESSGKIKN